MDSSVATLSLNDKRDIYFVILSVKESTLHLTCHSERLRRIHFASYLSFWASAKNPEKHETNGFFGRYALSEWQARHLFCHSEHLRRILGVYLSTRVLFRFQNTPHSNPESLSSLNPGCLHFYTIWKSHPWRSDLFCQFSTNAKCSKDWEFLFFIEHSS